MTANTLSFDEETGEKLVEKVRELRPLLEQNAARHESTGRLSDEVVDAAIGLELWKMAAPRRWGGLALSLNAIASVGAELAKGCPSTAWVVNLMNSALWMGTTFPDPMQEAIFADGIPRLCSVATPGQARPVDGGYVVTGRWPYASGCHHAEWAHLAVVLGEEDPPVRGIVTVPMSDVSIDLTWDVAGLKGSGSDTIVATDLFVPPERVYEFRGTIGVREPGARHVGEASDFWPYLPALKSKALGVLVGTAEGLVDSIAKGANRPVLFTSYTKRADSHVFQAAIGEAVAKVGVARTLMEQSTSALDRAALDQRPMSDAERAAVRGQTSAAVDLALEVTNKLMNMAGSSSFMSANPAQRYWRDLHVAARHALLIPEIGYEILGRATLGIEPNIAPPDFY
jgi:3-hydroxy-9,10-secoandrosta-1,3,5(10)-triene-9,17-dione monooxygenase